MRTVPLDQFYADASPVDEQAAGEQLVVTSEGKAEVVGTSSRRPRMNRELAEQRSVGNAEGVKFDSLEIIKQLIIA